MFAVDSIKLIITVLQYSLDFGEVLSAVEAFPVEQKRAAFILLATPANNKPDTGQNYLPKTQMLLRMG